MLYANSTANISSSKLKAGFCLFVLTIEFLAGAHPNLYWDFRNQLKNCSDFLISGNYFFFFLPFKMFVFVTSIVAGCIIIYYRQMSLCKVLSFFNEDWRSQTSWKTCVSEHLAGSCPRLGNSLIPFHVQIIGAE